MSFEDVDISKSNPSIATPAKDRTVLAAVLAILLVIPALVPAALIVFVYRFFLAGYVADSWIPYLPEFAMMWFPEMLRGMITGACAMGATHIIIKSAEYRVVRFAAAGFWAAVFVVLGLISLMVLGPTFEMIGMSAMAVGLIIGLFVDVLD